MALFEQVMRILPAVCEEKCVQAIQTLTGIYQRTFQIHLPAEIFTAIRLDERWFGRERVNGPGRLTRRTSAVEMRTRM